MAPHRNGGMITGTIHSPLAVSVKGMLGGAAGLLGQTATASSAYSGIETVADPRLFQKPNGRFYVTLERSPGHPLQSGHPGRPPRRPAAAASLWACQRRETCRSS